MNEILNDFRKSVNTGSFRMNITNTSGRKWIEFSIRIRLKKRTKIQDILTFHRQKETGFINKMKVVSRDEDREDGILRFLGEH